MSPAEAASHEHAARDGAGLIADAYADYLMRLDAVVRAARTNFEQCDWAAVQRDSSRRLDLYNASVDRGIRDLTELLGDATSEHAAWAALRAGYARLIEGRADAELAETFFNSITRRVFHTIGVDPAIEFVSPAVPPAGGGPPWRHTERFSAADGLEACFRTVLERFAFAPGYEDLPGDAARIAAAIASQQPEFAVGAVELARPVFYRGKGAYLIGHLHGPDGSSPLLLALTNPRGRVVVDAVLTTADEVSVVFSFARSYFFVELERPREMVDYLRTLMPRKPVSELYNALGFNKHGKTELYRSLLRTCGRATIASSSRPASAAW
jgi:isocitrate dehydrogenase kinase/phosphatase